MGDHMVGAQSLYGSLRVVTGSVTDSKKMALLGKCLPPDIVRMLLDSQGSVCVGISHPHWCMV